HHSFPTRRSSDLAGEGQNIRAVSMITYSPMSLPFPAQHQLRAEALLRQVEYAVTAHIVLIHGIGDIAQLQIEAQFLFPNQKAVLRTEVEQKIALSWCFIPIHAALRGKILSVECEWHIIPPPG